jgi:CRISPR/Cas system-associated protein Csm6
MVAQHAVNAALPGLEDVIDRLTAATFDAPTASPYEAAVRRAEERVLVDRVMWLASASPNGQVRAIASLTLAKLATRAKAAVSKTEADTAQRTLMAADIKRFLERPLDLARPIPFAAPDAPPGAPIGEPAMEWLARPPGGDWRSWNW